GGGGPVENAGAATPRRGGTLRAAFTGGGAAESLDPYAGGSPIDFVRNDVIYDSLFGMRGAEVVPALATEATPAADARSFTLRLREGVVWHDGSPFTARDVAYSLRYMSSPDRPQPSQLAAYVDPEGVEVRDEHTLYVPTRQPVGDPALFLAAFPGKMVPDGATAFGAGEAVGTGPYTVDAFEAGREARLRRFDRHWDGAAPADELVLLSLSEAQAKVNAVRTGQADYAGDIPYATAKAGAPSADLEIRTAGAAARTGMGFVLNTTKPPFDDPRARKAVRLGIDRKALVDAVLLGYGVPGNDLFCAGAKYFSDREPLARDVGAARRLLREAGAEGAEVTIRSAEWEIGYNASTQLLAEQLKDIGLTVRPQIVGPAEFFAADAVAAANGIAFSAGPVPLVVMYARLSAIPALAMPGREFQSALTTAIASTAGAERAGAWARAQNVMAERGNTVIWGLADALSLARTSVAGVEVRGQPKYPYLGKAGLA
ncbi:ABC transporter substrate-binding protein, partial [Amycolatopsis cihanbeyliensis]